MARPKKSSTEAARCQSANPSNKVEKLNGKAPKSTDKPIRKQKKKRTETFSTYIHKVLKQVHPDLNISGKAMKVMDSMVNDVLDRLVNEAGALVRRSKKTTTKARDMEHATRLLLPADLAKYGHDEAMKAVETYNASRSEAEDGANGGEEDED